MHGVVSFLAASVLLNSASAFCLKASQGSALEATAQTDSSQASQSTRVALLLAYDGAAFSGWSDVGTRYTPSVSHTLQKILQQVHGAVQTPHIQLDGASRTDAGVHALGQTAVYTMPADRPVPFGGNASIMRNSLNRMLQEGLRVRRIALSTAVPTDWHPSCSASAKEYLYTVCTGPAGRHDPITRHTQVHGSMLLLAES
jgi:tRNA pseudouridine38-40 synthase